MVCRSKNDCAAFLEGLYYQYALLAYNNHEHFASERTGITDVSRKEKDYGIKMPRHSTLIPLSHDHHEALLIALRLKKGGPTSQHDHLWQTDIKKQVHSLQLFFERELLPHFTIEEEILFPVASTIPELQDTIKNLLAQHQMMREAMRDISHVNDETRLKKELADFGALLESHVRIEERELFPKLEEAESEGRITLPYLK